MKPSPALEILDWMERGALAVLWKHRIEPDTPERMRLAAKTADAKQAAAVFEYIQELRVARDPDTAAHLALEAMYLYMDGREQYKWVDPLKKKSKRGAASTKRKAEKRWEKWDPHILELIHDGCGPKKTAEVLEAQGCGYSKSAIIGRHRKLKAAGPCTSG